MAAFKHPIYFSQAFSIDRKQLDAAGVLDPTLNVDTRLFIDPLLIETAADKAFRKTAYAEYASYFEAILKLLAASKLKGDTPWRNLEKIFSMDEVPGTCLGYGGQTVRGRRLAASTRARVLQTATEIVALGVDDPHFFALLSLIENGVGPDSISDMATRAIIGSLIQFNERILGKFKIDLDDHVVEGNSCRLPSNPYFPKQPIILVPVDILRPLPIVKCWSDIESAAAKNEKLRKSVNEQIGEIWKMGAAKRKAQIRRAALSSKQGFEVALKLIKSAARKGYDRAADPEGIFLMRDLLMTIATDVPFKLTDKSIKNIDDAEALVVKIVEHFVDLIENRGTNKLLWFKGTPRHEDAAQRAFYAVAEAYCVANNLDVSPEADNGAGPVDFKFSLGKEVSILVEIKLSTNTKLVSGYSKQLERYKKSAGTDRGVYLVVDVGRLGTKLRKVELMKNAAAKSGIRPSQIFYADASIKPSASKT